VNPKADLDDVEKRKFLILPDSNSDPSVVPIPTLLSRLLYYKEFWEELTAYLPLICH
jgi:hypothetical protein